MQHFLRHQEGDRVDVLGLLNDLAVAYNSSIQPKLRNGFQVQEMQREEAIFEVEMDLRRERNDIQALVHLYRALATLLSGPNKENQDTLLDQMAHEPVLLFLTYMEYSKSSAKPVVHARIRTTSSWFEFTHV
eukprot:m.285081 g.285081  ORF g.285081 m.285081 type:complete len:132 (-) comp15769_c0_seq5:2480-2875(-)